MHLILRGVLWLAWGGGFPPSCI